MFFIKHNIIIYCTSKNNIQKYANVIFIISVGQIEILAYNLRNFKMLAERKLKSNGMKAMKRFHIEDGRNNQYYIRQVLKNNIIHYNAIIR